MRTSFNIPDAVVEEFDQVWQEEGLKNRSRAVREAMLEYIESHSRLEETTGDVVALVGFRFRLQDAQRGRAKSPRLVANEYSSIILES